MSVRGVGLLPSLIKCDKSVGADSVGAVFVQLGSVGEEGTRELSIAGGCVGAPHGLSRFEVFATGASIEGVGIEDGGVKVGIGGGSGAGGSSGKTDPGTGDGVVRIGVSTGAGGGVHVGMGAGSGIVGACGVTQGAGVSAGIGTGSGIGVGSGIG